MFGNWLSNSRSSYQYAINSANSTLRGKVSDQALWAVNLAEYSQSLEMMIRRLQQVSRFTRALLRRNPFEMMDALGYSSKRPHRPLHKRLADTWLEWSFGWKPLINDIYASIDLLQTPIKAVHVKTSKGFNVAFVQLITSNPALIYTRRTVTGTDFCTMGCEVTINNPNLYLANNLGLANPAIVVWELIPFSFVVDWFVSVGEFLNSGSAWYGLTVTKPYTTWGSKRDCFRQDLNVYDSPVTWSSSATGHFMVRETQILESAIIVKPQHMWPWKRAANAAAVAAQLVGRVK